MKVLGIDYGDARIGVAFADTSVNIAMPYEIINNKGLESSILAIKKIINTERAELVIIGMPISLEGHKSEQTHKVAAFMDALQANIDVPIKQEDERLSTHHADQLSFHQKGKKTDDIAAMLILQTFLDKNR